MIQLLLIFFIVFIFTLIIGIYKSLKKLNSMSEESWSKVQSSLDAKYEIVSSLIDLLRSSKDDEFDYDNINELTETRIKSIQAFSPFQKSLSEQSLDKTLKKVIVKLDTVESFSQDNKYIKLKTRLSNTDKELLISTNYYNAVVSDLNSKVQSFPSGILAGLFGISSKELFRYDLFNNSKIENRV